MDTVEHKLEVIRKLLAKAERAATPDEADAYNTKAAEMMARHGVDEAMLQAAGGEVRDRIGSCRITMTDPYSREKALLATGVADAMGCRTVLHPGMTGRQAAALTVMGFESDLQRVEVVFTSLLLQATIEVVRQRPPTWSRESTTAFRRTWMVGFSSAVYQKLLDANRGALREHEQAAHDGQPSAALVLADRRTVVDRAFDDEWGHLRKSRPRRLSGTGYGAGAEAGRRADVGQTRLGRTDRALGR
jgi:hypothetical protein